MACMTIGLIGLGRMGLGIGERLLKDGYTVYGFDLSAESRTTASVSGIITCTSLAELGKNVSVVWIMVPAGDSVDQVITQLQPHIAQGTIIVDGGNSHFMDTIRRYAFLKEQGFSYIDCGTSGGLHGKDKGYCLMVGGDKKTFDHIEPLLKSIATQGGYAYMGPAGAGHYVKMVHNGIEYALLQSYAEGFHLLKEGYYKDLDLAAISDIWQHGSIIRSWILELSKNVLQNDQEFTNISGRIGENKTGQWTLDEAHAQGLTTPMLKGALEMRAWSRTTGGNYATKMVALLRKEFGGHPLEPGKNSTTPE